VLGLRRPDKANALEDPEARAAGVAQGQDDSSGGATSLHTQQDGDSRGRHVNTGHVDGEPHGATLEETVQLHIYVSEGGDHACTACRREGIVSIGSIQSHDRCLVHAQHAEGAT
jgi:hypothetical protein